MTEELGCAWQKKFPCTDELTDPPSSESIWARLLGAEGSNPRRGSARTTLGATRTGDVWGKTRRDWDRGRSGVRRRQGRDRRSGWSPVALWHRLGDSRVASSSVVFYAEFWTYSYVMSFGNLNVFVRYVFHVFTVNC